MRLKGSRFPGPHRRCWKLEKLLISPSVNLRSDKIAKIERLLRGALIDLSWQSAASFVDWSWAKRAGRV